MAASECCTMVFQGNHSQQEPDISIFYWFFQTFYWWPLIVVRWLATHSRNSLVFINFSYLEQFFWLCQFMEVKKNNNKEMTTTKKWQQQRNDNNKEMAIIKSIMKMKTMTWNQSFADSENDTHLTLFKSFTNSFTQPTNHPSTNPTPTLITSTLINFPQHQLIPITIYTTTHHFTKSKILFQIFKLMTK